MKNLFLRTLLLILIVWCFIAQLYFIAGPLFIFYLFKYRGYELIVGAILIDGYYQAFYSLPLLSISTVISVFLVNLIKPQLLMYNGDNEVVS